jgi:hypothetical protein
MTGLVLAAAFGAAPLASQPSFAGDELAAETCLRTKVWDGYADGWGIRTMTATTLAQGATRNYLVTLYKGNEYRIRTCGDDLVKNLDLYLYDLNGNVVKRDDTEDREPALDYKPEQTGTFYIVVHARTLTDAQKEAGVAMAVTYR